MNKTDKLARDRFGGDLTRAVIHIASLPRTEMDVYTGEMTNRQLLIFMEVINHKALSEMTEQQRVEELGSDYVRNKVRKMLFSREEFVSAGKNPYVPFLVRDFGCLAAAVLIPLALVFLFPDFTGSAASMVTAGFGVVMTFAAIRAADSVASFLKFRRYQKLYSDLIS